MSVPLNWVFQTFDSRTRTAELLAPELENSSLTQHDYELAINFLPGTHRFWPSIYAAGAAGAMAGYGNFYARPRWPRSRLGIATGGAAMLGLLYGDFRAALAHRTFVRALEDPKAFMGAIQNVYRRVEGHEHTPSASQLPSGEGAIRRDGVGMSSAAGPEMVEDATWDQLQPTKPINPNVTGRIPGSVSDPRPQTKWDQIRAENARNAGRPSSWDILRQQHERTRIPSSSSTSTPDNSRDDRTLEQARFDALLEAERCKHLEPENRDRATRILS